MLGAPADMSLSDLNGVTDKMRNALEAHNEAVKRLSTGKGNALSLGERIRDLGVRTKRPMPTVLVDDVSIAASTENSVVEEQMQNERPGISIS